MKSKVLFTEKLDSESVVRLYETLGKPLSGRVCAKVHSGEAGNQNYMTPLYWRPVIEKVQGTVCECNTAYGGARNTLEKHLELMHVHEWDRYFDVDIMDAEGDTALSVPDGVVLKENLVGSHLLGYDSMLVLSHFKGHPAGGYGGALKQLSIGCASSAGKARIHSGGFTDDVNIVWGNMAGQDIFLEAMADAAASVVRHFDGNIVYINVMKNLSVDCDCCDVAEDPCMADIGILASLDPVAIDKACLDLVYAADDPGREHFLERVESLHGIHTIEAAESLGIGTSEYELIRL